MTKLHTEVSKLDFQKIFMRQGEAWHGLAWQGWAAFVSND